LQDTEQKSCYKTPLDQEAIKMRVMQWEIKNSNVVHCESQICNIKWKFCLLKIYSGHLRALLLALSEGGVVHYNCLLGIVISASASHLSVNNWCNKPISYQALPKNGTKLQNNVSPSYDRNLRKTLWLWQKNSSKHYKLTARNNNSAYNLKSACTS